MAEKIYEQQLEELEKEKTAQSAKDSSAECGGPKKEAGSSCRKILSGQSGNCAEWSL